MRKRLFIFAVLAVMALIILYGFMLRPVPIEAAKVSRGPLKETIEEEGKTLVKDRFVISAPITGFMRRIKLEIGDPVEKGQIVVELEPSRSGVLDSGSRTSAEAAVAAAEAGLRAAEERAGAVAADADYAKSNLGKRKKLFESRQIAKIEMEQTESEAKRMEAERLAAEVTVKTARSELERAHTALHYAGAGVAGLANQGRIESIRSPISGRVLKKHREGEGAVNSGDLLIDVGDTSRLEVRVEVVPADAVKIKPGMPVLFGRWDGDEALSGKVKTVEPQAFTKVSSLGVEEQRVLVIADFTSLPESWQKLGDSYRVEARFIIWEGKDVLQVPAGALFRQGEKWAVLVVQDGKARQRGVTVGHANGLAAEIVSGLAEGDEVVLHPQDSVKDGVRVKVR